MRAGILNGLLVVVGAAAFSLITPRAALGQQAASEVHSCEGLAQLELHEAKIISAQTVAAGEFTPPGNLTPWLIGDPSFYKTLGAFCRVVVEATPSADSSIKIEV